MSNAEPVEVSHVEPVFITARQLGIMLQVSTRTLWRMRSAGRLPPSVRLGGIVRWRLDDVMRWIDRGCPERQVSENKPGR